MLRPTQATAILGVVWVVVVAPLRAQESGQVVFPPREILFDSERHGNSQIYIMNPDGSNQHRLTYSRGNDQTPAWSPDGKRITFASDRDGNREIYVMDRDGSHVERLTHTAGKESQNPAWSPDGKKIAFASDRDGNMEIYVMGRDGSDVRRLTHTAGKESENPDWSPDGKRIAFDSNRDGHWEIYVMCPDGSDLRRLTQTPNSLGSEHPAWSPNGKRIAFDSTWSRTSKNWLRTAAIYVMDADGSTVRRLTHTADKGRGSLTPVWSPNGKRIIFSSNREGTSKSWAEMEIYMMYIDGSNVRRLTFNKAFDGHPAW